MTNTRFPNGIKTKDIEATGYLKVAGACDVDGIFTASKVVGVIANAITVDCTDSLALIPEQKVATYIKISASGTSKVLTLGMVVGQVIFIQNAGEKAVTVKNLTADTGVSITAKKTAIVLVTAGEPIKIVEET